MTTARTITKAELAERHNLDKRQLAIYMNVQYYDELVKVGYQKHKNLITPIVFRKFEELHGKPLTNEDFNSK